MHSDPLYLLAVCASLKPAPGQQEPSACRTLLQESVRHIQRVFPNITLLDLRQVALPAFEGLTPQEHYDSRVHDIHQLVSGAAGLVLSVPAYWGGVGGAFKSFVETISGPAYKPNVSSPFAGKPTVSLLIGADETSANAGAVQLRTILTALGANLVSPVISVSDPTANKSVNSSVHAMIEGIASLALQALGKGKAA